MEILPDLAWFGGGIHSADRSQVRGSPLAAAEDLAADLAAELGDGDVVWRAGGAGRSVASLSL